MQCHTIKIAQKLSIYNRFKNNIPVRVVPVYGESGVRPSATEEH